MRTIMITVLLASTASLAGCKERVTGNGQIIEDTRQVTAFDRVAIGGSFQVVLKQAPDTRLTVITDDNIQPLVLTEVADGRLRIYTEKSSDTEIKIQLVTPSLTRIDLSGAVEARLDGIKGSSLEISGSGAAEVTASGEVEELKVEGSGAMSFNGGQLRAKRVEIDLSGAGSATVYAGEELDVEISGAGTVNYFGQPARVKKDVSGVGSVQAVAMPAAPAETQ